MNFDDSFPKRVSIARNAIGLTQSELAKKVGVVQRQIAAYEGGEARPRANALQNLAAALGTTTEWLAAGHGEGPDVSAIQRTVTVREIPVYTHAQALVADGVPLYSGISPVDFIPAPPQAGENAFALEVTGNSMTSPFGVSFPEGYMVCFDPDIQAQPGDFVLCSLGLETTFKQLIRDQGYLYLRPLNPIYSLISVDSNVSIIAVAIHAQIDLLKASSHVTSESSWGKVEAWGSENAISEKASLYLKLEEIEEKLNTILADKDKKPT